MDFLDPRKQRAHRTRLMVGYVLIALAVGLGTVVLVYNAYGYGINAKTGDVIQNGLLFVDSRPGGASISLNGKDQKASTASRLILPAKDYLLSLKKTGYRDWSRKFTLSEHAISRFVYPYLVPAQPKPQSLKAYNGQLGLLTQSPDRRWLLVQPPRTSPGAISLDQYDLGDLKQPAKVVVLPASLLTEANKLGDSLVEVEWSSDNRHVVLRHDYTGGNEFIIFDRENPAKSLNLNKLFNLTPSQVALRNKKTDQVYIYSSAGGLLQVGDVRNGQLAKPFLQLVQAFKAYGTDLVTYVTTESVPADQAVVRIWDNGKTYALSQLKAGSAYLIDAAQFQGHWYYTTGSNTSERINIYKDPLDRLKDPSVKKATPFRALKISAGQKISFSTNARFIGVESAQKFAVYDLEELESFSYNPSGSRSGLMHWMDGHRWLGLADGAIIMIDFDGTNQQSLVLSTTSGGGFFDRNFEQLLSSVPGEAGVTQLQVTDMRAGSDLPN